MPACQQHQSASGTNNFNFLIKIHRMGCMSTTPISQEHKQIIHNQSFTGWAGHAQPMHRHNIWGAKLRTSSAQVPTIMPAQHGHKRSSEHTLQEMYKEQGTALCIACMPTIANIDCILQVSDRSLAHTWKTRRFWRRSGSGNSILRSRRPGRSSAGSSVSARLVAMITCSPSYFVSPQ